MSFIKQLFRSSKKLQKSNKTKDHSKQFEGYNLKRIKIEAREAEANNDYGLAISLLTEGRKLITHFDDYYALPKLLQRAGDYESAVQEIQRLLKIIPEWIQHEVSHQTPLKQKASIYALY